MFSVALQLYSVREAMRENLGDTLARVAEYGYAGVEFAGLYGRSPEEIRELCEKNGLIPLSSHVQVREIEADPSRPAGCKKIGTPYMGIPGHQWEEEEFGESIRRIRAAAVAAQKAGLKMLYHNHDNEIYKKIGKVCQLEAIFSEIPAELLQTEFDVGWLLVAGEDPAAWLRRYRGRAPLIHLKDFTYDLSARTPGVRPADLSDRSVGRGLLRVSEVLSAAEEAGTEWLIVEDEIRGRDEALASVQASRAYLRALGI